MKGCPLCPPHLPPPFSLYWVSVFKIRDMNLIYPSINNSDGRSQKDHRILELAAGAQRPRKHFQGHQLSEGVQQP